MSDLFPKTDPENLEVMQATQDDLKARAAAIDEEIAQLKRIYCAALDLMCKVMMEGEVSIHTESSLFIGLTDEIYAYDSGDNKDFYNNGQWREPDIEGTPI